MIIKTKPFPRGGSSPALKKSAKSSFSLLGKMKSKVKIKNKKNKSPKNEIKNPDCNKKSKPLIVKVVEELNGSSIQEGMLLLGIISQVTEKVLSVSLPGNIRGVVTLANFSEFHKNLINQMTENSEVVGLKDMFKPGDILPFKIITVSDQNSSLMLTCDPYVINSKLTCDVLETGLILSGNVKSREDYGFVIDFGILHAFGFLHVNKIKNDDKLKVGQIIRCAVLSSNKSAGFCNLQVSILEEDLQSCYIDFNSTLPIMYYIPGLQFKISVTKVLKNGLEVACGSCGNSVKGYIHEDYLLNKFPVLSKIKEKRQFIGTLLFVKSLVNIPYFKLMPKKKLEFPFQYGEIVKGKVIKARRSGLIVKIMNKSRKAKCFIPISRLNIVRKLFSNEMTIDSYFPVGKELNKIRLGNINYMGRYYIGATDKDSLEEKYYSVSDLKCGEVVSGTISSFSKNGATILIGKTIKSIVALSDMTDVPIKNPASRFKIGQEVKVRVMEIIPETKFVRVTMKPTLLTEKEILSDHNFTREKLYLGVVCRVLENKLIVKFFNNISGFVAKQLTSYPDAITLKEYFHKGQLIKCYVLHLTKEKKLALSMLSNETAESLKIGKKYKATIIGKINTALLLSVQLKKGKNCTGYLPMELLTIHQSLAPSFLAVHSVGDDISVYCLKKSKKSGLPIMGTLEIFNKFYAELNKEGAEKLMVVDSVLPFLFKKKNFILKKIFLQNLIPGKQRYSVRVVRDDSEDSEQNPLKSFQQYCLIYGKILRLAGTKIDVSIKVTDVWEKNFDISLEFLDSYLNAVTRLINLQKAKLRSYSENATLGLLVSGLVEEVRTNHAIIKTEEGDLALVEGKFTKGQKIRGTIVWINPLDQIIHVAANFNPSFEFLASKDNKIDAKCSKIYGKIVFVNENLAAIQLRGRYKGKLAYIPLKRHLNDVKEVLSPFSIGDELLVYVTMKESKYLLAMDHRVIDLQEKLMMKKTQKKLQESIKLIKRKLESEKLERSIKKRKESESEDLEVVEAKVVENINGEEKTGNVPDIVIKQEVEMDDDFNYLSTYDNIPRLEYDDIEIKSEEEAIEDIPMSKSETHFEEKILLSSSSDSEDENEITSDKGEKAKAFEVDFKWEVLNNNSLLSGVILNEGKSSSENEEEETKNEKKKRQKLTHLERMEKSRKEEQRLRLIEKRLMDADRQPETVDDFDRAVLANPDSSTLWLKYMAFHIQGTEIEEARIVARRALKAISFREEQEKLNIWIALLNLENLYGNEETFGKISSEALQYNEPYKIHLHVLNLHGKGNKLQEMEKLGNFMLKKYKDVENMWVEVATAYFLVGKVESARLVLQRALTSVPKKQHIMLVSKFAQLENKYGSPERAQTLYESILGSYPKRVDVWSCYVDMLVKSQHLDLARQVLERATSQSLRPRKMKILFKKFLTFEENHGTPENVEKVREAAVEYVQTVGSLHDA